MRPILSLDLALAQPDPWLRHDEAVATRVRLVLETPLGALPWRPDFGCDLAGLVGQPATAARLNEVRWRVEQAVRRWVPTVKVARCRVETLSLLEPGSERPAGVPLAELALMSLGTQVAVEVNLDLETPQGPLHLSAQLLGEDAPNTDRS